MATMSVSLPDPVKDWVEAQVRTGRYGNASDCVRDLIRRDQERADKIARMQLLLRSISGVPDRAAGSDGEAGRRQSLNPPTRLPGQALSGAG